VNGCNKPLTSLEGLLTSPMTRGATKLDGARVKKQVWRPLLDLEVFRKQMYCTEESTWDFSAPGEL